MKTTMTQKTIESFSVAEMALYAFLSIEEAPFTKAVWVGQSWEHIQRLEVEDFDDELWAGLEYCMKKLGLIEDDAPIWKRTPQTWDEPEDWDFLDTVFEQKLSDYKTLLMEYVFHVAED